jgi:hypothetical protein
MRKKITILIAGLTLTLINIHSQRNYQTSAGLRIGSSNGITVKHFLDASSAIEGILSTRWRGIIVFGMYEKHQTAFRIEEFNFFYGAGAHLGFWNEYDNHPWFDDNVSHAVVGVDGIIGLEYTIPNIPFNISMDWKPAFNIVSYTGFWLDVVGFSIRYNIK